MDKIIKKQGINRNVTLLTSLILAIETHNIVAFEYHKDVAFAGIRKVEPHNIYWNKEETKILLDGVQIDGDSKSGIKSFKQFDTGFMKECIILDDKFDINRAYNPQSPRYDNCILGILA